MRRRENNRNEEEEEEGKTKIVEKGINKEKIEEGKVV